jgi:hypothetical protein
MLPSAEDREMNRTAWRLGLVGGVLLYSAGCANINEVRHNVAQSVDRVWFVECNQFFNTCGFPSVWYCRSTAKPNPAVCKKAVEVKDPGSGRRSVLR